MSRRRTLGFVIAAIAGVAALVATQAAGIAASALLHPARHNTAAAVPSGCEDLVLYTGDVPLRAWRCAADGQRRGTIVYLHGIADNRASGRGIIARYRLKGFDVLAYDSRAHGDSGGEVCTYGYFEKRDVQRVIDTLAPGPVILFGTSLGAAVALQAAAHDDRVSAIIAAEVFSDLRTVARERAPFFLTNGLVARALRITEQRGGFPVDAVSPLNAAKRVRVPVLLIHGAEDTETRPAHSERVFEALAGPKRLILVDGAGHNRSLSSGAIWSEIDRWIETRPEPSVLMRN